MSRMISLNLLGCAAILAVLAMGAGAVQARGGGGGGMGGAGAAVGGAGMSVGASPGAGADALVDPDFRKSVGWASQDNGWPRARADATDKDHPGKAAATGTR
jgi:hypothetical protein